MFAELLAHDGVTEELAMGSSFGFLAFHGGSLERMTEVVAREAAESAGASYYGVIQPEHLRWHIPSKLINPARSERFTAFLDHVDTLVAVHGYGRHDYFTTILLGGRDRLLAEQLAAHVGRALPEYSAIHDLEAIPTELRGQHPDNPVNQPARGGVQLELPPRVRGLGPHWADHGPGLTPHTKALIDALSTAARSWPPY